MVECSIPNPPPNPPPMPPPKNCLNSSSGLISSSNIGPRPPPPRCAAKPEKGEAPDAAAEPKRASGSPPNLSYLLFLSASLRIWKARLTTVLSYQPNTLFTVPFLPLHP